MTASATSCTGSPPRTSEGQRTLISRSAPSYPSMVVDTSRRVDPLPQAQPLGVAEEAEVGRDGDALTGGGVLGPDVGRHLAAAGGGGAGGGEVPGALTEAGAPRILLLHDQLVADVAGAQQVPAALRERPQPTDAAAARRIDGQLVELVADRGPFARRPLGDRAFRERERLEPHAGNLRHDHAQLAVLPYGGQRQARVVERDESGVGDGQHVLPLPGGGVEDDQVRAAAGRRGDVPGQGVGRVGVHGLGEVGQFPPAGEQVDVDLVGLGAGDGVVVGAVDQLPPRLVERRVRIRMFGDEARRGSPTPRRRRAASRRGAEPVWCRCRTRPCRCRRGSCPGSAATLSVPPRPVRRVPRRRSRAARH